MQVEGYTHTHRTGVTPTKYYFLHTSYNADFGNTKIWKIRLKATHTNFSEVGCKNKHKTLHLLHPSEEVLLG